MLGQAVGALWWFVWGWSVAALVLAMVSAGTAAYYLFTPPAKRQMEDAAERLAAAEKAHRRG